MQPSNMFLDANGDSFLGDFGATVRLGEEVRECTPEFLPSDMMEPGIMKKADACIDNWGLAATILTAINQLSSEARESGEWGMRAPVPFTLKQLKAAAAGVKNDELKQVLNTLLNS